MKVFWAKSRNRVRLMTPGNLPDISIESLAGSVRLTLITGLGDLSMELESADAEQLANELSKAALRSTTA